MQVFQTEGDPPRRGKIILAIIGWTQNSSEAETKSVRANSNGNAIPRPEGAGPTGPDDVLVSEHVETMLEGPMREPLIVNGPEQEPIQLTPDCQRSLTVTATA